MSIKSLVFFIDKLIADDRLGIGFTKRDNKADITICVAPEHQKIQVPKRVAIEIHHHGIK